MTSRFAIVAVRQRESVMKNLIRMNRFGVRGWNWFVNEQRGVFPVRSRSSCENAVKRWKIAVLTTHPIQYQAPWFRASAAFSEFDFEVFFCHQATPKEQANSGF